jgi:hypothetical protein
MSMVTLVKINLACQVCGNNRFSLSEVHTDDAPVTCFDCGHELGTLGSLKAQVELAVMNSTNVRENQPAR